MDSLRNSLVFILSFVLPFFSSSSSSHGYHRFLECLSLHIPNHSISAIVYPPQNPSFSAILQSSIKNPRFTKSPKPLLIITPLHESQIQATVLCSRRHSLQIRTLSGGHDYEGLSYTSTVALPFLIIDLIRMSKISINVPGKTAWIQTGATIGKLYYEIASKSRTLAFPAGSCPTVGVGGHFSGGGFGFLFRKYGLSADNIVDARIVDVDGRILDRKSMGEDLFWAIRGGGGASYGVITAWKLNLVSVPEIVTVFSISRSLEQDGTKILHKWQFIAPYLPKDLIISVTIARTNSTIIVNFISVFLGGVDNLMQLVSQLFPELGLKRGDCVEVSWIQSALFVAGFSIDESPKILASRILSSREYFKAKSDYVQEAISENGFEGIWKMMYEIEAGAAMLIFSPYGGRMAEIRESAIPYPHRAGYLYKIQYLVSWDEAGEDESERYIDWIRRLYDYMTPYVSKSPRGAYVNYRDLDIGVNNEGNESYAHAGIWGFKYFGNNFNRLVRVKTMIDPSNFFRNEQSIPPLDQKS